MNQKRKTLSSDEAMYFFVRHAQGVTQSCVTAGIVLLLVLFLVLFILSLSLSSGMGGEKE
jgi:hypothetical protein